MTSIQDQSRAQLAASLLLQAPPGQVSQVYQHLRTLLSSEGVSNPSTADAELQRAAEVVLEQYNIEQLVTVRLPGEERDTIICRAAQLPKGRFADHAAKQSFKFDHLRNTATDPQPLKVQQSSETIRVALDEALAKYIPDRYTDGTASVFVVLTPPSGDEEADNVLNGDLTSAIEEKVRLTSDSETGASTGATGTLEKEQDNEATKSESEKEVGTIEGTQISRQLASEEIADSEMLGEAATTVEGESETVGPEGGPASVHPEATEPIDLIDDPVEAVEAATAVEEPGAEPVSEGQDDLEPRGTPKYVIHIVGNRYNLSNYWSGRWRCSYTYDPSAPSTLSATAQVQVHYFESGNVQLSGSRTTEIELVDAATADSTDPSALARTLVRAIERHEDEYENNVTNTLVDLNERAFKALRRQLPVTRQKIDWDKVLNYKIGSEMAK